MLHAEFGLHKHTFNRDELEIVWQVRAGEYVKRFVDPLFTWVKENRKDEHFPAEFFFLISNKCKPTQCKRMKERIPHMVEVKVPYVEAFHDNEPGFFLSSPMRASLPVADIG